MRITASQTHSYPTRQKQIPVLAIWRLLAAAVSLAMIPFLYMINPHGVFLINFVTWIWFGLILYFITATFLSVRFTFASKIPSDWFISKVSLILLYVTPATLAFLPPYFYWTCIPKSNDRTIQIVSALLYHLSPLLMLIEIILSKVPMFFSHFWYPTLAFPLYIILWSVLKSSSLFRNEESIQFISPFVNYSDELYESNGSVPLWVSLVLPIYHCLMFCVVVCIHRLKRYMHSLSLE